VRGYRSKVIQNESNCPTSKIWNKLSTSEPKRRGKGKRSGWACILAVHRWLLGQIGWIFLTEIFARTILINVILLAGMRRIGEPVSGQPSFTALGLPSSLS
jgi:hypothetical protein